VLAATGNPLLAELSRDLLARSVTPPSANG